MLTAGQLRQMRRDAQREIVVAAESVLRARKCLEDESLSVRVQLAQARLILRDGAKHLAIAANIHNNIRAEVKAREAQKRRLR